MKILVALVCLITFKAFAQDPAAQLSAFDHKVYSLKTKGVKDFTVDIESSKLTQQLNEQKTFGNIKDLKFRVYWTASPQRIGIDVLGMPEGFKEVKEELKASVLASLDDLLPLPVQEKFKGYKITSGPGAKEFTAQDTSGIAPIPTYILKFDARDILSEVIGKRPIGSFHVANTYEKESFSDGKWVLKRQVTTSEENGQKTVSRRDLVYGDVNGIGVLEEVTVNVEQKWENPELKPVRFEETLELKNYKINNGDGMRYFLGDANKK